VKIGYYLINIYNDAVICLSANKQKPLECKKMAVLHQKYLGV